MVHELYAYYMKSIDMYYIVRVYVLHENVSNQQKYRVGGNFYMICGSS